MQETWVWSLNWEDSLEKEMATHSSILLGNPMDRGACRLQVHGVTKETWQWLNNSFFVLPWNLSYSAFQSDCCFKWTPDPSKYPLGAQVKGESDMTTEIYFREVGGWECLGSTLHLPVVTPIICPGGSYKKIGYYDSTKDDLSWSKTDKWIGKWILSIISFNPSEPLANTVFEWGWGGWYHQVEMS